MIVPWLRWYFYQMLLVFRDCINFYLVFLWLLVALLVSHLKCQNFYDPQRHWSNSSNNTDRLTLLTGVEGGTNSFAFINGAHPSHFWSCDSKFSNWIYGFLGLLPVLHCLPACLFVYLCLFQFLVHALAPSYFFILRILRGSLNLTWLGNFGAFHFPGI